MPTQINCTNLQLWNYNAEVAKMHTSILYFFLTNRINEFKANNAIRLNGIKHKLDELKTSILRLIKRVE